MLSENTSDIVGAEPVWPASSKIIPMTINTYFTWYVHFIVIQQI
jgi:hypothetical protein